MKILQIFITIAILLLVSTKSDYSELDLQVIVYNFFQKNDIDHDKLITPQQMMQSLEKQQRLDHSKAQIRVKQMLLAFDIDNSGSLSPTQFLQMTSQAHQLRELKKLQIHYSKKFSSADSNSDGILVKQQMFKSFKSSQNISLVELYKYVDVYYKIYDNLNDGFSQGEYIEMLIDLKKQRKLLKQYRKIVQNIGGEQLVMYWKVMKAQLMQQMKNGIKILDSEKQMNEKQFQLFLRRMEELEKELLFIGKQLGEEQIINNKHFESQSKNQKDQQL